MPPDAGIVLEAGCGAAHWQRPIAGSITGFFTSGLRRIPTRRMIAGSNGRIDRLIVGDVETASIWKLGLSRGTTERGLSGLR